MPRLSDRLRSPLDAPSRIGYRGQPASNGRGSFSHGLESGTETDEMRVARVASLHLRGYDKAEIAEFMQVTPNWVTNALVKLKKRWAAVALMDIDAAVAETLSEIERLKDEYWDAWHASQNTEIVMRGMKMISVGDAAFLDGVMKCIDRKCKLLGLDSPIKIDISAQVRAMAIAAGLDPDDAVAEAQLVIEEAKVRV